MYSKVVGPVGRSRDWKYYRGHSLSAGIYDTVYIILHSVLQKMRKLFPPDISLWTIVLRMDFLEFFP